MNHNHEQTPSDSESNPHADRWLDAFSNAPAFNADLKAEANSYGTAQKRLQALQEQLAKEQLELMNLEGELAVAEALNSIQERQLAADEAEWEREKQEIERQTAEEARQDAEYAQMLADIKREDAEYEATLAELRQQEEAEQLEDTRFAFANIDFDLYDLNPDSSLKQLTELIGVYADIKPLATDYVVLDTDTSMDSREHWTASLQDIQKTLQSLGITFTYTEEQNQEDNYSTVSWWATKDPELIKEFQTLQERYPSASPAEQDNITRRQGQLLGYPATATEYFIAHTRTRQADPDLPLISGGVGPKFSRAEYVHSPEHAEAEYASYEEPLYAALRHFHPEAGTLLDQQISPDSNKS